MKKIITLIALSSFALAGVSNAQSWSLNGNAGTNAATNFIGTTDNQSFKIKTNNAVRMVINASGKVAIGMPSPVYKLDVKGGSINTDSCYRINGVVMLNAKGNTNILIGDSAGPFTTGDYNTFNGWYAGKSNTTGSLNTITGANAGSKNTTGSGNTFTGLNSGLLNENGNDNCFYGNGAGRGNVSGSYNIFMGESAGWENTTGGNNVAIGHYSGDNCGTGSFNTFIGDNAGIFPLANNLTNATAIGAFSKVETSNSLVLGGTDAFAVKVGIGIAAPTAALDVKTVAIASTAIRGKTTTNNGNGIVGDASNGASAYGVWGKSNTGYAGYFSGNLAYTGTLSNVSDERLKENINPFENALDQLMQVDVKTYVFKKEFEKMNLPKGEQIGFIAQNLEKTFPNLIMQTFDKSMNDSVPFEIKTVNYTGMIPVLTQAVKEINIELQNLRAENAQLKNEIEAIKAMLTLQNASVKMNTSKSETINIAPNPAKDKAVLTFNCSAVYSSQISVTDNSGKTVITFSIDKNLNQFELNTQSLANGTYLVNLISDGKIVSSSKLIVSR